MKFLILGAINNENTFDLEKEIKKSGHQVVKIKPSSFIFKVINGELKVFSGGIDLSKFDVYIPRGYNKNFLETKIFAEKMLSLKKIVVDEFVGKIFMQSKLFEASKLPRAGINYPQTHYIVEYKSFEDIKNEISYPAIVKPASGQKGRDIYKFKNEAELKAFLKDNSKGWLIQECLEIDGDVRIFVVGGKALGAMKRFMVEGDYRSNISLGARAEAFNLTIEIENMALKAVKTMGYEIAGVDLAYSNGKWYVIEVNSTPQWQGFKKSTGINPAKFIVEYCIAKFKKKND